MIGVNTAFPPNFTHSIESETRHSQIRRQVMSCSDQSTSDGDAEVLELAAIEDVKAFTSSRSGFAVGSVSYALASSSAADSTDGVSDAGAENVTHWTEQSGSRIASQAARKNRARVHRYYRSKTDLVGLKLQVLELQGQLNRLQAEDASLVEAAWMSKSPSPFTDCTDDEISPNPCAPPKSKLTTAKSVVNWKDVALMEYHRRRRALAVRRKLKRLIRDFGQGAEAFVKWWAALQVRTGVYI